MNRIYAANRMCLHPDLSGRGIWFPRAERHNPNELTFSSLILGARTDALQHLSVQFPVRG